VTRSIGDQQLGDVLTSVPDIVVFRRYPQAEDRDPATAVSGDIDSLSDRKESVCDELLRTRRQLKDATFQEEVGRAPPQQLLVLGSDGLWDVMGNQEAVDFVCESLLARMSGGELPPDAFHSTARLLAHEAYVRGSMDNIGVALVDLLAK
jgi:serine/threonine protein phosphatase PrpC